LVAPVAQKREKLSMRSSTRFVAALAACFVPAFHAAAAQMSEDEQFTIDQISEHTVQNLALPGAAGEPFRTIVELNGIAVTLSLEPYSIRGDDFKGFISGPTGREQMTELPAPLTYRGAVDQIHGSNAAGSLIDGRLHASIDIGHGGVWVVEPMTKYDPAAAADAHVVYRQSDVIERQALCGVLDEVNDHAEHDHDAHQGAHGGVDVLKIAELACDTDFEFYQWRGSNSNNVIADIENVINQVNVIYERDIELLFEIVHIEIRSSSNDPYTTTNAQSFLQQFAQHWFSTKGSIHRDLATLFSGKNFSGSTIGIAYLPGLCNTTNAYSVVQGPGLSQLGRVGVSAHEFGHNFSAPHCSGSSCRIMCAGLGGCSGNITSFGPSSQTIITNYKNARSCLTEPVPPNVALPFFDAFNDPNIDEFLWPETTGNVTTTTFGQNPPSEPRMLAISGGGSIRSISIDVNQNIFPDRVYFSFYAQQFGVAQGDTLRAEFLDRNAAWQPAATVTSAGGSQTGFSSHEFELPITAYSEDFQIRFTSDAGVSAIWFVDDVSVSLTCLADVNGDQSLDVFDFLAFQDLFVAGSTLADINGDGTRDIFDFLAFQDRFATGCYQ
jgi:hypothetical protein